jgi:protocatechuate 3,4-dioxygenase beta subunit
MTRLRLALVVVAVVVMTGAAAGAGMAATPQVGGMQITRDPSAQAQTGAGVIAGTVVTTDTPSQPVRHATVTVSGGGLRSQRQTVTDTAGRFAVTDLPAGKFSLSASKPAYLQATYGKKQPGQGGTQIDLAAGQRTVVEMKMPRGAVLVGTVVDPYGRPKPQVRVQALQYRTQNGQRRLIQTGNGGNGTDDRGTYRIYGLPPGEFVVVAMPQDSQDVRVVTAEEVRWAQQDQRPNLTGAAGSAPPPPGPTVGFSPIYYPGVADIAAATTITLATGEERAGLDFQLQPVPTAKVEGVVLDPEGRPAQQPQLNMISSERLSAQMPQLGLQSEYGNVDQQTGRFTFRSVTPGRYTIFARSTVRPVAPSAPPQPPAPMAPGAPNPPGRGAGPAPPRAGSVPPPQPTVLWARGEVEVSGRDIASLALTLQPSLTLSGRLAFERTRLTPPDAARVRLSLSTIDPNPYLQSFPNGLANADGTFTLQGVMPGKYRLSATAVSAPGPQGGPWAVKSVLLAGRETIDASIDIGDADVTGAVITFTDLRTSLTGSLTDASGAAPKDLSVLVFSTDRAFWTPQSRRVRVVTPNPDGKFRLDPWPPGEYYMVAVTDGDQIDLTDRNAMEQIAAAAVIKITLAEGESKVQDLRVAK